MSDDTKKRLIELSAGVYVEADVLNIVEKIKEYDPNLKVKYCEPGKASADDPPYKIVEVCPDGLERTIFGVWVLDETVIQRIHAADNAKNSVLTSIDNANLLAKKIQDRRYEEIQLEDQDIVKSYLNSPKGRFSFHRREDNALVTIDDQPGRKHTVDESR